MSSEARRMGADVVIVGFGFSGLATLVHLVRAEATRDVVVVTPDTSGLGLAYSTTDPGHLLNVRADRMGIWAQEPDDFARWLQTAAAHEECDRLDVPVPGADDFAPRVLYGAYLRQARAAAVESAALNRIRIRWVRGRVSRIVRAAGGWSLSVGPHTVHASRCVLATGNDPRAVFGSLTHPNLHRGPWQLSEAPGSGSEPVVLVGSGLTAVDAVLTLRRVGHSGPILALSRSGRLPHVHRPELAPVEIGESELARMTELSAIIDYVDRAGRDWRQAVDALRPHTQALWQRLPLDEQQRAVKEWASTWNIRRHRMAPEVGRRIAADLRDGRLRVLATRTIVPVRTTGGLELTVQIRDGERRRLRPAAVIDCTGPQLVCGDSDQPLLRDLIGTGICVAHHTGLGLLADRQLRVADGMYALGSLLTGQLWESVAVPELREQAAGIAAHAAGGQWRSRAGAYGSNRG